MKVNAFDIAASRPWLILPESLHQLLTVADRMGDPEALQTKLGRPLDNTRTVTKRDGVAIVPISGPIFRHANLFTEISGATSTEVLATDINAALSDPTVKAIVLDIDSPGGDAAGINELSQMIYDARGKKPIHAYVGGTGASAAYWIASAASKVTIDATAMVGSIGVVMTYMDTKKRDEKADVRKLEFVSNASPDKRVDPTTESGRVKVQKIVDDLAAVFVAAVARNRNVSTDTVLSDFGRGGVLVGAEAVSLKMADGLGSLEAVISELASSANNVDPSVRRFPMSIKVATTAALLAAVQAGHKVEQIEIDASAEIAAAVEKAKTEALAAANTKAAADIEAAVKAERTRIVDIQSIAAPGFEKEVGDAIASGASAADTSFAIMKAAKDRGVTLTAIAKDSPNPAARAPAQKEATAGWEKAATKLANKAKR